MQCAGYPCAQEYEGKLLSLDAAGVFALIVGADKNM